MNAVGHLSPRNTIGQDGLLWSTDCGHRTLVIGRIGLSAAGHVRHRNTFCLIDLALLYC